jgi:hypothetical protein
MRRGCFAGGSTSSVFSPKKSANSLSISSRLPRLRLCEGRASSSSESLFDLRFSLDAFWF